jgi:hypothetical protein
MHAGYDARHIRELRRRMITSTIGIVELIGHAVPYWRTIEIVTPSGLYIEHDGPYTNEQSAENAPRRIGGEQCQSIA